MSLFIDGVVPTLAPHGKDGVRGRRASKSGLARFLKPLGPVSVCTERGVATGTGSPTHGSDSWPHGAWRGRPKRSDRIPLDLRMQGRCEYNETRSSLGQRSSRNVCNPSLIQTKPNHVPKYQEDT